MILQASTRPSLTTAIPLIPLLAVGTSWMQPGESCVRCFLPWPTQALSVCCLEFLFDEFLNLTLQVRISGVAQPLREPGDSGRIHVKAL